MAVVWGLAVAFAIIVSAQTSGAHLNPAVSICVSCSLFFFFLSLFHTSNVDKQKHFIIRTKATSTQFSFFFFSTSSSRINNLLLVFVSFVPLGSLTDYVIRFSSRGILARASSILKFYTSTNEYSCFTKICLKKSGQIFHQNCLEALKHAVT